MGKAGRRHVVENYARAVITDRYLALVQETMAP